MKRILLLPFAIFILAVPQLLSAQDNVWNHIKDYSGISIYWRWRKEMKDQYVSELKFENHNGYKVEISFKPHFICADGTPYTESSMSVTVKPYEKQSGQWAGLYFYPCKGTQPPRSGGYKDMIVKKIE